MFLIGSDEEVFELGRIDAPENVDLFDCEIKEFHPLDVIQML